MTHPDLASFVAHARERGLDPASIRLMLASAGWKDQEIAQALAAETLELPIPAPPDSGGAREAFLHLLAFAALYTAAASVLWILTSAIDLALPDPARAVELTEGLRSILRGWLAAVLVAFPLYLGVSRLLVRELAANPSRALSGVRRWLTYMTLFLAAATLVVDVIVLVFHLLDGEWSLRFLAKVLVVGAVAAMIFVYYLLGLREGTSAAGRRSPHRPFVVLAGGLFALTVIWGGFLVGSPAGSRTVALDGRRVDDLRRIHQVISDHTGVSASSEAAKPLERPLPADLPTVAALARNRRPGIADPVTGVPYEYRILGPERYELCATFGRAAEPEYHLRWSHPAGRHCYTLDVRESDPLPSASP